VNDLIRVHADGTIEGDFWKNLWEVEQKNLKRYTAIGPDYRRKMA